MTDKQTKQEVWTYAEYINRFSTMNYIKKQIIQLNFPLDDIRTFDSMTEEELFMRKWDIDTFGNNKCQNAFLSRMWIEREMKKYNDSTLIIN